jgi:hypothetical protein
VPTDTPLPPTAEPTQVPEPTEAAGIEPPDLGDLPFHNEIAGYTVRLPEGWLHHLVEQNGTDVFFPEGLDIEALLAGSIPPVEPVIAISGGPVDEIFEGQIAGVVDAGEALVVMESWSSERDGFSSTAAQSLTVRGEVAGFQDVSWMLDDMQVAGRNVALHLGDRLITIQGIGEAEAWQAFLPTFEAIVDSLVVVAPVVERYPLTQEHDGGTYTIRYPEGWEARSAGNITFLIESQEVLEQVPPPVPVIYIETGAVDVLANGVAAGAANASEIVAAVGAVRQEERAEHQLGEVERIQLGPEVASAASVMWLENGVPVMNLIVAIQKGDWAILLQASGTVEGWADFSRAYGQMMDSLEVQLMEEVDHTNPVAVVHAIFQAARTEDFALLSGLCDPMGEHDGDTQLICEMNEDHPDRETFVELFARAEVSGEPIIDGNEAEVAFIFGVDGEREETMVLVQRDGKWYLFGF